MARLLAARMAEWILGHAAPAGPHARLMKTAPYTRRNLRFPPVVLAYPQYKDERRH